MLIKKANTTRNNKCITQCTYFLYGFVKNKVLITGLQCHCYTDTGKDRVCSTFGQLILSNDW